MRFLLALLYLALVGLPCLAANEHHPIPTGLGWRQLGGASSSGPFVVTDLTGELDQERALVSGTGFIVLTDGGPNANLTISLGTALPVANGGTGATDAATALINLIGSPTKGKMLVGNGTAWTTLSVGSDDQVLTADNTQETGIKWNTLGSTGPSNVQYLVLALDAGLSNERRLVGTANKITLTDAGANGDLTLNVGTDIVQLTATQTLTNKTLTNPIVNDTIVVEKGANDVTLTFAAPGAARAYNFPNVGADSDVILSSGAQTKAGVLTLSAAPVLSTGTLTVSGNTVTFPGDGGTVVYEVLAQTLSNKTLLEPQMETSIILTEASGNYTITWDNPAANRDYGVVDVGGAADFVMKDPGDSYTAGGVAYADGNMLKISSGGTLGQVYTMGGSNIPGWANPNSGGFGGDGSDGNITVSSTVSQDVGKMVNAQDFEITNAGSFFIFEYTTFINATGTITVDGQLVVDRTNENGGNQGTGTNHTGPGARGGGIGGGGGGARIRNGGDGAGGTTTAGGFGGASNVAAERGSFTPPTGQWLPKSGGGGEAWGEDGMLTGGGSGLPSCVFMAIGAIDIQDEAILFADAHPGDSGAAGDKGGGGGGACGNWCMYSQDSITIDASATIRATGGNGGAGGSGGNTGGGGGGGGGSMLLYAPSVSNLATPNLAGGSAGAGNGTGDPGNDGEDGTTIVVIGTPNTPILGWIQNGGLARIASGELTTHKEICRAVAGGDMVRYFEILTERTTTTKSTCLGIGNTIDLGNAA